MVSESEIFNPGLGIDFPPCVVPRVRRAVVQIWFIFALDSADRRGGIVWAAGQRRGCPLPGVRCEGLALRRRMLRTIRSQRRFCQSGMWFAASRYGEPANASPDKMSSRGQGGNHPVPWLAQIPLDNLQEEA